MKLLKNILFILLSIPNIPFITLVSLANVYIWVKNTTYEERVFGIEERNEYIKENASKMYPKHFRYFVAIMFYMIIAILILKNCEVI